MKTETEISLAGFLEEQFSKHLLRDEATDMQQKDGEDRIVFEDATDAELLERFREEKNALKIDEFLQSVRSGLPSLVAVDNDTEKDTGCVVSRDKEMSKPPTAFQNWKIYSMLEKEELGDLFIKMQLSIANKTAHFGIRIGEITLTRDQFLEAQKDGKQIGTLVWNAYINLQKNGTKPA